MTRGSQHGLRPDVIAVDDSAVVRKVIEASLTQAGIHVLTFPDGPSLLRAAQSGQVVAPGLVVLDINMPRMSGYDVADSLRHQPGFADAQIIMLTGQNTIVDRVRSRILGASEFIAKPFSVPDFVATVCRHLDISPHGHTGGRWPTPGE
ncbi:MAG TPA: response regulator [Ktedonobacterales bacterium]|jgi:DNA-binding response OmpR family regulator